MHVSIPFYEKISNILYLKLVESLDVEPGTDGATFQSLMGAPMFFVPCCYMVIAFSENFKVSFVFSKG